MLASRTTQTRNDARDFDTGPHPRGALRLPPTIAAAAAIAMGVGAASSANASGQIVVLNGEASTHAEAWISTAEGSASQELHENSFFLGDYLKDFDAHAVIGPVTDDPYFARATAYHEAHAFGYLTPGSGAITSSTTISVAFGPGQSLAAGEVTAYTINEVHFDVLEAAPVQLTITSINAPFDNASVFLYDITNSQLIIWDNNAVFTGVLQPGSYRLYLNQSTTNFLSGNVGADTSYTQQLAYDLRIVPAPGAWMLLGGLPTLALTRRRR